jgi:NAD(P)-dependent dehydrogenase (short-subunit alcohol dehydrogenase family)
MTIGIVLGAGGGIGGALWHHMTESGRYHRVFALSRRRPDDVPLGLWIEADLLREDTLAAAADRLAREAPATRILVATGRLHEAGLSPEKSMRSLSLDAMARLFAVNAAGPALAAKHLLPLTPRDRPSAFAVLSARVGSIGDNQLGGWYAYRASKAALNMLVRTLAIEHRRTRPEGICVALHPGTVDTGLSKPFQAGVPDGKLFTPAYAAASLLAVLDGLGPDANGGFFAWDGTPVAW